jgi:hypothetical protein
VTEEDPSSRRQKISGDTRKARGRGASERGDYGAHGGTAIIPNSEVEKAFRSMVKSIRCPSCEVEFSDWAVDWGRAWAEGRRDRMRETGEDERDGPYQVKCELCGHRSWIDYFRRTARSAEGSSEG